MTGIKPILFEGHEIIPLQFLKALLPDPASLGPRTVGKTCTHGMNIADSFVRYWKGNLYFIGYRAEGWPADGVTGMPLRSYVMRYDIERREFHKVIEFFDRTCFLFVIRDGVLFMECGEDAMYGGDATVKYLCCVDLEAGEACRISLGISDACGICRERSSSSPANTASSGIRSSTASSSSIPRSARGGPSPPIRIPSQARRGSTSSISDAGSGA